MRISIKKHHNERIRVLCAGHEQFSHIYSQIGTLDKEHLLQNIPTFFGVSNKMDIFAIV